VDEAAIIQLGDAPASQCRMSIDKWGYLHFGSYRGNSSNSCKSPSPVPKARWVHLAATYGESGVALYMDGIKAAAAPASQARLQFSQEIDALLGRSPDCPVVANTFPTGVLNGLLRDVRVYDGQLLTNSIAGIHQQSMPESDPNLQINAPWCADDPHRPVYHPIPPRAWTNEPHGLIHWGGQYHLFYQKNPNGPYWGHIHWGHMTSPDLYRWTEMPVALSPEPGPDAEGCWSGSVIDHDGRLALIYTAGGGPNASICLAQSNDGIHFTKFRGNPIIPMPPNGMNPEFRDPFVWREGDAYYLLIGSAVKNVGGTALLYRSRDLVSWEYRKQLLVGDRETSGVFWEMPIFVKIGDDHALIVCEVPGRASYWIGSWQDETFTPHTSDPRRLELFNHLLSPTPIRNADGQIITMGIIPDEKHPKECWKTGWAHHYSLPRVLSIGAGGHLVQNPYDGIDRWRDDVAQLPAIDLQEGTPNVLEHDAGVSLHLHVRFKRGESRSVSLLLRRAPDAQEQTEIRYQWDTGTLTLDRSRSSLDAHVKRDIQEATYFPPREDSLQMDLFLDHSVLEVFVDNSAAFAAHVYPSLITSDSLAFACTGSGARAEEIAVAKIKRPS
jgi:sucrose-6-phosphate hydrolase SacC (GH32 family)